MKKLIMLRGLQASGKSTWAKKTAREQGFKVVNKDQLRAMIDDGQWSKENERLIIKLRDEIIVSCLSIGKSVIVDDTNFNSEHEKTLKHLARVWDATFEINDSFLSVPLEECIDRDSKRTNPVGEKVIRDTYERYLKNGIVIQQDMSIIKFDEGLPKAVICDIDGTIAHCKDRSVYDYSKVINDELDERVYEVLSMLSSKYKIVIVSGRDGACRKETEEWLKKNNVHYDDFFMRPAWNTENDAVIKKRILVNDIIPKYFPILAVEDRNQVVRMWRDSGLKCFQVADGNF